MSGLKVNLSFLFQWTLQLDSISFFHQALMLLINLAMHLRKYVNFSKKKNSYIIDVHIIWFNRVLINFPLLVKIKNKTDCIWLGRNLISLLALVSLLPEWNQVQLGIDVGVLLLSIDLLLRIDFLFQWVYLRLALMQDYLEYQKVPSSFHVQKA